MGEKFENFLSFIKEKFFTTEEEKPKKTIEGRLAQIKNFIKKYSAQTFEKRKTEKTEEIPISEGMMQQYPSPKKDFREDPWFKKLDPEKKEKAELEIFNFIHKTVRKEIERLHNEFFEKLPSEIREYFKENRKREEENKEPLLPSKKLREGVIEAIQKFEEQFGFPPGDPKVLTPNCAAFVSFVGKVLEYYGFNGVPVRIIPFQHVGLLVDLKGNKYVSDIIFKEPFLFKEWIKKMKEKTKEKKKIELDLSEIKAGCYGTYLSSCYYNLGIFFENLGDSARKKGEYGFAKYCYDRAKKEYENATEKDPQYFKAYFKLGNFLLMQAKFSEAEEKYKEAIKINPTYASAHYALGDLYSLQEEIEKAEEEFLIAKELYQKIGNKKKVEKCDASLEKLLLKKLLKLKK